MANQGKIDDLSAPTKDILKEEGRDIIARQTKLARQLVKGSEADTKLDSTIKNTASMDSVMTSTNNNLNQMKLLLSQNSHHTEILCQSFDKCLSAKAHADSIKLHKYS